MEGSWHLYRPTTPWRRPVHEARVVLHTEAWHAVGFALGITEVLPRDQESDAVGHLGPDLLGPDWDEDEALRRLTADPARPIGEALLDQRNLAGVGNMYKAELCFIAGVHPDTPVGRVPDLRRMVRRAKQVLEANKERVQQATTGDLRRGRQLWVYARGRQSCLRCGTRIAYDENGGRPSYWCPVCQPLPEAHRS
jgi:endonuclease VIII